jgi:hypothetical protein
MVDHKRRTWLLVGGLLLVLMFGLALVSPARVVGQGEGTPTHEPPPPRTIPPGIRQTPEPSKAENTPQPPPPNPSDTLTPTPVVMLPTAGGSRAGADWGLSLVFVMSGLGLCALGLAWARRSHTE